MTETTTSPPSNPYVIALLWIGGLGIVASLVLAVTAAMTVSQAIDLYGAATAVARGAALATSAQVAGFIGVVSFVGGLVILGVRWRPKERTATTLEGSGPVPASGHWLDKKH